MKQAIKLKPELKLKQNFNNQEEVSLKILMMDQRDLLSYLRKLNNPFLTVEENSFLAYDHTKSSLLEHLLNQNRLEVHPIKEDDIYYLVSLLDSNGYFKTKPIDVDENIIKRLQTYEPIGCFANDLRECLRIQCEYSDLAESETGLILCDYLQLLAENRYEKISQETGLEVDEVIEGFEFIRNLNPKPAINFSVEANTLIPEIKVSFHDGCFFFESFNPYFDLDFEDLENLNDELMKLRKQAKFILTSVQKRNLTLIQIMNSLCDIQRDYLLEDKPLKYCTLETVANRCGIHISTVSRAIAQKSFEWKNKNYLMASLFSKTKYDVNYVKKLIKYYVDSEGNRVSDAELAKIFNEKGIQISRRTVSKYRSQIYIKKK